MIGAVTFLEVTQRVPAHAVGLRPTSRKIVDNAFCHPERVSLLGEHSREVPSE
jgi:hypothetical protein